jgi:hypothetical protein
VVAVTSPEGTSSQPVASAIGMRLQVGTSIGDSVDSGAAPYSGLAAFFLVMTSVMVSATVTRVTTLLGIARSTPTAITPPWVATFRILGQRINRSLLPNRRTLTAPACAGDQPESAMSVRRTAS